MLQRDYLMRMIEQCAQALARILGLKPSDPVAAITAVEAASRSLVGLELEALLRFPPTELLRLLTFAGRVDLARGAMAVRLIAEAADLAGNDDEATRRRRKARALFAALMPLMEPADAQLLTLHRDGFTALARTIDDDPDHFPEESMAACRCYELYGEFGRAEDRVYDLTPAQDAGHARFAREFYERLLLRSDDELARGNLPRDEVVEAIERLRATDPNA